ncbi:unnamed protein product [Trichogramma brassicae]|uniref:Uncharacterized protein n=1 Tax=Trichogramma brassicae TaxID=86971 RepID=A0A6H5IYF3_9HYME|nr:unnamed protein product [Trichogramma brassicae]
MRETILILTRRSTMSGHRRDRFTGLRELQLRGEKLLFSATTFFFSLIFLYISSSLQHDLSRLELSQLAYRRETPPRRVVRAYAGERRKLTAYKCHYARCRCSYISVTKRAKRDELTRPPKYPWNFHPESSSIFFCVVQCDADAHLQHVLPREIFKIEWLLGESIEPNEINGIVDPRPLVDFVIETGYKDEPEVDEDGKPLLRRTTPIHHAAWKNKTSLIPDLFEIYDRFDVNYSDERGYTHFHVACRHGHKNIVKKFLDRGQDPNVLLPNTGESALNLALKSKNNEVFELLLSNGADPNLGNKNGRTLLHLIDKVVDAAKMLFELSKDLPVQVDARDNWGNTPLHLAMRERNLKMIEFLLRRGADPNAANEAGSTPLHVSCRSYGLNDHNSLVIFFKISEEANRLVQVDAKDNLGRTPLQWAVANLYLRNVDVLLNRGADLSDFVFPTEAYHGACYAGLVGCSPSLRLAMASGTLLAIEILEAAGAGYELHLNEALTIMKFFAEQELFEQWTDLEKHWVNDEEFAREAKEVAIIPSLSIYDLIGLRPARAAKLLTHRDYYDLARSWKFYATPKRHKQFCVIRLCEIAARGFFRRWALDPLLELTNYELPILCCDKILDQLMNQDLYHVCLAAYEPKLASTALFNVSLYQ